MNCGCAADCVCCTPSLSLCDASRTVSDTEMHLLVLYMDCVAMCLKRKFQNKPWTLLYFSAKSPSTMMESLLLLFGDLGEIAFRQAFPFR